MKKLILATLFAVSTPVWATTPASGTLTDSSGPVTFAGGPYFVSNPNGISAGALPESAACVLPTSCDLFALTVTIADKYRKNEKNKKEIVQIVLTGSNPVEQVRGTADIDLYLLDSGGVVIGSSTSPTYDETINVPLSLLKDGAYTVRLITGIPLGSSAAVDIHIGKEIGRAHV